jgi:hypothetical protein
MSEGKSLININVSMGNISKVAELLIEKISNAIGVVIEPYQIPRLAKAESKAEIIRAQTQIEITDLERRAMVRWITEESQKQDNIEIITLKALPELEASANPQKVENDWITNFFDKCRIVSDEEMQSLWAKVLAGEANSPGAYSKRTVNLLGSIDKSDAQLFTSLCGFGWLIGNVYPLIYDVQHSIYNNQNINFGSLTHLDDIGLVSFKSVVNFSLLHMPKQIIIFYHDISLCVQFDKDLDNQLEIGFAMLTQTGQQLARICDSKPVDGFLDYVLEKWYKNGLILSSPYPRMHIKTR